MKQAAEEKNKKQVNAQDGEQREHEEPLVSAGTKKI